MSDGSVTDSKQFNSENINPDSKVHGANVGPTWGRKDPGWPMFILAPWALLSGNDFFVNVGPTRAKGIPNITLAS